MAKLTDEGYILLSAEEFKSFIKGEEKNNNFLNSFYSEFKSIDSYSLHAKGLKVEEELIFDSDDFTKYEITISDSIFEKRIIFNGGDYNQVWFTNCRFKEEFRLNNGNFKSWLWLTGCDFDEDVKIYNGTYESFHYSGSSLKNKLSIKGGFFNHVNLYTTDVSSGIEIDGLFILINYLSINAKGFQSIEIRKCNINILKLHGVISSGSLFLIENINIYNIVFEKNINLGNIYLSNITVKKYLTQYLDKNISSIFDLPLNLVKDEKEDIERNIKRYQVEKISDYVNNYFVSNNDFLKRNRDIIYNSIFYSDGNVYKNSFVNVDQSEFKIIDSVLGKTLIKNLDFKLFDKLLFHSSDLSSISLINAFFPTRKGSVSSLLDKDLYKNLYHLYNDLYSVSSKQNNLKDKIEYYKASQENLLLSSKGEKWSFKKWSSVISISVSKLYSDFGQNWIQSLTITVFIIGPIFYGLVLWSSTDLMVDISKDGVEYFYHNLLQYYPQFLNPTHKLTYFDNLFGLGKWTSLIDIISRVFIGIGIFETIRSFRKYVRK